MKPTLTEQREDRLRDTLRAAYPALEPSRDLTSRVERMAQDTVASAPGRIFNWKLPIALGLASAMIAFLVFPARPAYRASSTLYFPSNSGSSSANRSGFWSFFARPARGPEVEAAIKTLDSTQCRVAVESDLHLQARWNLPTRSLALARLQRSLSCEVDKNGLLALDVSDTDRHLALGIASSYITNLASIQNQLAVVRAHDNRLAAERDIPMFVVVDAPQIQANNALVVLPFVPVTGLWIGFLFGCVVEVLRCAQRRPIVVTPQFRESTRALTYVLAAGAAMTMIFSFMISMTPKVDARALYHASELALSMVTSAHIVQTDSDGTKRDTWFQNGMWRRDGDKGNFEILRDGAYWQYDPVKNSVYIGSQTLIGDDRDNYGPASLDQEIRDFREAGGQVTVQHMRDEQADGRTAHVIEVGFDDGLTEHHKTVWVDATSDLPIKSVEGDTVTTYQYGVPVPASMFEPAFPQSASVTDHRIKTLLPLQVKTATVVSAAWHGSEDFSRRFPDQFMAQMPAVDRPELAIACNFEYPLEDHHQFDQIWMHASPHFMLHASGRQDVPIRLVGVTSWTNNAMWYGAAVDPVAKAKMVPGVPYSLIPVGTGEYGWAVSPGVTLAMPAREAASSSGSDIAYGPSPTVASLRSVTITGACWYGTAEFRSVFTDADLIRMQVSADRRPDLLVTFRYPEWSRALSNQLGDFSKLACRTFVLSAPGHPDVHADLIGLSSYSSQLGAEAARVRDVDRPKIADGVTYRIAPEYSGGHTWRMAVGVSVMPPAH